MGAGNKSHSIISMSLSVCLFLVSLFTPLLYLASGGTRLKCSVFCARSLSLLFGFIWRFNYPSSVVLSFSVQAKRSEADVITVSAVAIIKTPNNTERL